MKYLLLALLLLAPVYALDVTILVEAPQTTLPGEAATISISATLSNVSIISFPATAELTFPDGTTAALTLNNTFEGTYTTPFYSTVEGKHTVVITVALGDEIFTKEHTITVAKPAANIDIKASLRNGTLEGTITQSTAGDFKVEITPFSTGDLTTKTYTPVCSFTCGTSCTFSCAVNEQSSIAKFTTQKVYTYTTYIPVSRSEPNTTVTYDRITGVDEPEHVLLSTAAEAYTLFDTTVSQVPIVDGKYSFTPTSAGEGTIIIKNGQSLASYPVSVIERTNVQPFKPSIASDGTNSWWFGFVATEKETLLKLPSDPGLREAYLLAGNQRSQLRWEKGYIVVPKITGWVEIKRAQPAPHPTRQTPMPYGMLVGGQGIQRHEFPGTAVAIDLLHEQITTYTNGSTSVVYTHDATAAVVPGIQGSVTVTQPLQTNTEGMVQYDLAQGTDTTLSIYTFDGLLMQRLTFTGTKGTRSLLFTLPPGSYLAVASAETNAATGFFVLGDEPSILLGGNTSITTEEDSQINLLHTVMNNDLFSARTIDITTQSKFAVTINGTDTDGNGLVDITLAPGERKAFTSTVYVPVGASSGEVVFIATSGELNATLTDTIIVENTKIPVYVDADVVSIQGTAEAPVALIQNNNNEDIVGTLYVSSEALSTQLSITFKPGMNEVRLPAAGERITVRLQIPNDEVPQNNERTREFRQPESTRLVHVNERLHSDREQYTIQLPTISGHVLVWYDGETQRTATAMINTDLTVWNIGALPANHEFYAALVPGEISEENLTITIDNTHPAVTTKGTWAPASTIPGYIGFDYLIDLNLEKTGAVIYAPRLPNNLYSVYIHTPGDVSLAENVPVTVHAEKTTTITLNEAQGGTHYLGLYEFTPESSVAIENYKTNAFVIADAISFIPISQLGGLEIVGNSTLTLSTTPNRLLTVSLTAYLSGVVSVETPSQVSATHTDKTLRISAAEEGEYVVLVHDAERTLTIYFSVVPKELGYEFNATLQTPAGPVEVVLATEQEAAALALAGDLQAAGETAGWTFDVETIIAGKEVYLKQAYLPNYTLPLTLTPVTEDRTGTLFIFDAYTVTLGGLQAERVSIEDLAEAGLLYTCTPKKERCKAKDLQQNATLTVGGEYAISVEQDTTFFEAHVIEKHKPQQGRRNRGTNWNKEEKGNQGILTLTVEPRFVEQQDGFVPINTTFVLADNINDLEDSNAAVQVKDNIVHVHARLESGAEMITLAEQGRTARLSVPQQNVRGRAIGNKLVYKNIEQSTDLVYEVDAGLLKEIYVLHDRSAPRTITNTLNLPQTVMYETPEFYVFNDVATNKTSWLVWKPFAYDSLAYRDGVGSRTTLNTTVTKSGDDYTFVTAMNDIWFDDPARAFPVYVDPTVVSGSLSSSDGGYIRTGEAGFPDDDMFVGEINGNQLVNGYLRLAFTGELPGTAVIVSANFSAGVQDAMSFDADDSTTFSFLNTSDAADFWADNFRELAEYNQDAITPYPFAQLFDGSTATNYQFTVNSTGRIGLQKILVDDRQTHVTIRASYNQSDLTNITTNGDSISWYSGVNCCAVTGTVIAPQLNISYQFENDTPVISSLAFNQSMYNTTQNVKFTVNIVDSTSNIDYAHVTLLDPASTFTNNSLTPSQATTQLSANVSTTAVTTTAQNRTSYDFFDDFSIGTNPLTFLWSESTDDAFDISGGQVLTDNTGQNDSLTAITTIDLSNKDKAEFRFFYDYDAGNDNGDCFLAEIFNGSTWNNILLKCNGNAASGTIIENLSSQYLVSTFSLRFKTFANGNDDDTLIDNVNVTSWKADREYNDSYIYHNQVFNSVLRNITSLSFTAQVTSYTPVGSANRSNTKPDIGLEVFNGSTWIDLGTFNLPGQYTTNSTSTTQRNFTLTTTASDILLAWENSEFNRDIRVRNMYMDYYNASSVDSVTYNMIIVNSSQTGGDVYEKVWGNGTLTVRGVYNATQVYANDTAGNENTSNSTTTSFTLYGVVRVTGRSIPGGLSGYPEDVNFTCNVTDSVFGNVVAGYNVSVTSNVSGYLGEWFTDATGITNVSVTITEPTLLTCSISNRLDLFYYVLAANDSRVVAVDNEAPQWSQWSLGNVNGANVSDGVAVNRTNNTLQVRSYWTDNIGIDFGTIEHNGTGTFENYTDASFGNGELEDWFNYTFDFSEVGEFPRVGLINVSRAYALDFVPRTNYTTPDRYFYLWGRANLTSMLVDPASPAIFEPTTFTCTVLDWFNLPAIGYNVSFYRNGTLLGTNVTGTTGESTITFSTSSTGTYTVNCNITDNPSDYYTLSTTTELSQSLTVLPDTRPPTILAITASPMFTMLGNVTVIGATISDAAGVSSAYANITLPSGANTSVVLSGGGTAYQGDYTAALEGLYETRITAADPSFNTNVSGYSHFIVGGKAALTIKTVTTRYNSNSDVDLTSHTVVTTADLEAGTQSYSAPTSTTVVTNISAYMATGGSCAGTTRGAAATANSCRRAGHSNKTSNYYGHAVMRAGYVANTISDNEVIGATMFDLTNISDDANIIGGNILLTINASNSWEASDDLTVYALTASNDATIWDTNGPEMTALRNSPVDFTVGTITGGSVSAGTVLSFVLTSTQLTAIENHLTSSTNGLTITVRSTSGDTAEWVDFNTGFSTTGVANDPELRINYTSPNIDYNGTLVNYTDVVAGNYENLTAIRINVTLSGTDFRGSNTSVFSKGLGRMPALRVNLFNGTAYQQKYACDILNRGITVNTTTGTCSIVIRETALVNAWRTATNRDVQLQAINLDNRNEGTDVINWTGVTVELFNGSVFLNSGPDSLVNGNLTLAVERSTSSWAHNDTVYSAQRNVTSGEHVNLSGHWNATAWNTGDRTEGIYRAVVRYTDSSGAVRPQGDGTNVEATFEFVINDTVAPTVVNFIPVNRSTMYGLNASGTTFHFNASDATGFTNCSLYVDSVQVNSTTSVNNSGATQLVVYNLAEGARVWHVGCFDNATARNRANSSSFTLYIDNTAPVVTFLTANTSNFSTSAFNISFLIADNNYSTLTWYGYIDGVLNTTSTTPNNTATNFSISSISEGTHVITIIGRDGGDLQDNESITITVDYTAPNAAINTSNNTYYNTSSPPINITLVDNLSSIINYTFFINGNANTSGQVNNNTLTAVNLAQVPEGNHSVLVQATDQAGNRGNSTAIRIIVDLTSPVINLNLPFEQYNTTATNISFNWTYIDNFSSTANCSVFINNTLNTSTTATNNTLANVAIASFAEGRWNWTVGCTDLAGNNRVSTVVRNFTVDRTPPLVQLVSPANATSYTTTRNVTMTYNVSDALTAVAACMLYINDALNQTTIGPAQDTNLNFNLTNLSNGAYQWAVQCNDSATNIGYSENRTFTVDISVHADSPNNNTVIDRDSVSTDPDTLTLVANLSSGESGATITFKANLTDPSGIVPVQTDITIGTNTTNTSGHALIYYDANSTTYAGNYTWWGEETRSGVGAHRTVLVYGGVYLIYNSSTSDPGSDYNTSQQVNTHYTITSRGPENITALNATYRVNVSVNFTQPNATIRLGNAAFFNGSLWNSTYTLASDAEIGVWNITAITNGLWFYTSTNTSRNFTVRGFATPISPANDTVVDRDGVSGDPDELTLLIHIPGATQAYTVNFTANLTDPVVGGQTDILLGTNTTNSSGHALFYYNPNSTMYAGNYSWWGLSSVSYMNGTRSFTIKGALNTTYNNTFNPNSTHFQNDTIAIDANVTSLGVETRSELNSTYGISVNSTLHNTTGSSDTQALVYRNPHWNGSHALLTLRGVGVWNTTVNATGTYWYSNWTNRTFTVYGFMNITANSTSPSSIYAYQTAMSSCTVHDTHTNYTVTGAIVSFYRNGALIGTNTTDSSGVAYYVYQVNTTGTHTITCNVSNQPGIYYYAGPVYEHNNTLTVNPLPITTVSPANGTTLDRDSIDAIDADSTILNVSLPGYVPDGVEIQFVGNLTAPTIGGQTDVLIGNNTSAGSYAVLYFNPNSSFYAGNWTWFGNASSAYANDTRFFIVKGGLHTVYSNQTIYPNASYNISDTANMHVNVSGYGPETRDQLSNPYSLSVINTIKNTTGISNNQTFSYTSPYWNGSHTLLPLWGVGIWNTSVNSSGAFWYSNATNRTFLVYSFMNITSNSTTPSSVYAYQYATTLCRVQDQYSSYDVSGATVSFYRSGTLLGTNTTNSSGHAIFSFQTNVTGTYTMTCNVSNQPGIYYYRGSEPEHNSTLTVTPFPITLNDPANNTQVDRDGTNPITDEILLNASIPAFLADGVPITFQANLTDPVIAGQTDVVLGVNTSVGGIVLLYYNPNSTSYAGNWSWFGVNSEGYTNSSRTFLSYGQLNESFENNTYNPNSSYFINSTITVRVNLTSLGPESRDQINASYLAGANATLTNTTGTNIYTNLSYSNPVWNGTLSPLLLRGVGVWNISSNSSANFFFNSSVLRTTIIYGFMNVTQNTTTPATIEVYGFTTSMCGVRDQFADYVVAGAVVSFYRNGTFVGSNTTNGTGQAVVSFQTNSTGNYVVTCNVSDQPGIYYYAGDERERNSSLTVTPFYMTPTNPANDTLLDRDSSSADADETILNISVASTVPNGVVIDFRMNVTDPSIAGQTAVLIGSNTTSGGSAVLHFNPNSSHYAGNYTWYTENADGAMNGTRTFLIRGTYTMLYSDIALRPNSSYFQNDTVTVDVNLTSLGPENSSVLNTSYVTRANVTFMNNTGTNSTVNLTFNGALWRNNTFSILSLRGVGDWNATAASTLQHFYSVADVRRNFTVYGFMNVTENASSPASIYAFDYVNSTCRVQDQHTNYPVRNANVMFYRGGVFIGSNSTNSSGHTTITHQINTTGTHIITCNVTTQLGIHYYAGNAPEGNSTVAVIPFPITPVTPANDTTLDRDSVSADADSTMFNVTVPTFVPNGVTINFTANLTDPVIGGQTDVILGSNTTTNGYAVLYYNPNSTSYAGNWSWFGAHVTGTPNGTRTYISKGSLLPVYSNDTLNPNSTHYQNDTVTIHANVTTYGPETRNELNSTYSILVDNTVQNSTGTNMSANLTYLNPYWSGTHTLLSLRGVGVWNTSVNASGTYWYRNTTNRTFIVYGYMNMSNNTLTPSTIFAFQYTTAACTVIDEHTDYAVRNALVSVYRGGVFVGSNTTNTTGTAVVSFQTNSTGQYDVTCNVSDQPGIYYVRGREPERNATLIVNPFPITPVNPANDSIVDRDSVSSDPDTLALNFSVPTYVPDGINIEFLGNLTSPVVAGQVNLLLGNNTTSGSSIILYFNPSGSYYAGNYSWFANQSDGLSNGTRTFVNIGALNLSFENETYDINENYTQNMTLLLNATLMSYGVEAAAQLNDTYSALVNASINNTDGNHAKSLVFDGARWNVSHYLLTVPTTIGWWNSSLYAQASYFYNSTVSVGAQFRNFTVYGYANITDIALAQTTIEAYSSLDAVCRLNNQFTNASVVGMNVSFYQNTTFIGSNLTNSSGHARLQYQELVTGDYIVICNITDDLPVYYYAGDERSMNQTINVTPIALTPEDPTNDTVVDREDAGFASSTITLVGRVHSGVPNGANISFYANLTTPAIGGQTNLFLGSNVTNNGQINLTINPNSSLYAGSYEWWMDSPGGDPNGTRRYTLMGIANVSYADQLYDPNWQYIEGTNATFIFNVTSFGPENTSQMGSEYASAINYTLYPPTTTPLYGSALYNGTNWNGSTNITYGDPGIWQTSAYVNSSYFFPYNNTLRNFSVRVFAFLVVFDVEEQYNGTGFAGIDVRYFANFTDRNNVTINGANCSITWQSTTKNMTQNAVNLYEANHSVWFEGILLYNATCEHTFYIQTNATGNISIHSTVNTSVETEARELASTVRQITMNVTNRQNYTEHDIYLHHFVPQGFTVAYQTTPVDTQFVSGGQFTGNSTRWYIPNLTAGQGALVVYNVTGVNNISALYEAALEVYTQNTSYVYG